MVTTLAQGNDRYNQEHHKADCRHGLIDQQEFQIRDTRTQKIEEQLNDQGQQRSE